MTHTSTEQPDLLPCPFCGGNAHFEIDMDSRWEWVECESCGMQGNSSASLMEDCKPKLREAWNRRTPASQAQRVPLSEEQRRAIFDDLWPHGADAGIRKLFTATVFATEAAHTITQDNQG